MISSAQQGGKKVIAKPLTKKDGMRMEIDVGQDTKEVKVLVKPAMQVYPKHKVLAAVAWLKEHIKDSCIDLLTEDEERIMKRIDEAFMIR